MRLRPIGDTRKVASPGDEPAHQIHSLVFLVTLRRPHLYTVAGRMRCFVFVHGSGWDWSVVVGLVGSACCIEADVAFKLYEGTRWESQGRVMRWISRISAARIKSTTEDRPAIRTSWVSFRCLAERASAFSCSCHSARKRFSEERIVRISAWL